MEAADCARLSVDSLARELETPGGPVLEGAPTVFMSFTCRSSAWFSVKNQKKIPLCFQQGKGESHHFEKCLEHLNLGTHLRPAI